MPVGARVFICACVDSEQRHRRPCSVGRAEFESTRMRASAALHTLCGRGAVEWDPVRQQQSYGHPILEGPNGYARRHNR